MSERPRSRTHLKAVPPPSERTAAQSTAAPARAAVPESLLPFPAQLDERCRPIWDEYCGLYAARLSLEDAPLLAQLVFEEYKYRDACTTVMRVGSLIKSPNNFPVHNPALSVAAKAQENALKIRIQLGLTPLSRQRVKGGRGGSGSSSKSNPFEGLRTLDD